MGLLWIAGGGGVTAAGCPELPTSNGGGAFVLAPSSPLCPDTAGGGGGIDPNTGGGGGITAPGPAGGGGTEPPRDVLEALEVLGIPAVASGA